MITIEQIKELAEKNGWKVEQGENDMDFYKFTPEGQDFGFSIDMIECKDGYDVMSSIKDYADYYDPDYEASLWVGEDGHGRNGAPYHLKDIVADMEAAQQMVYDLHKVLLEYSREHSE